MTDRLTLSQIPVSLAAGGWSHFLWGRDLLLTPHRFGYNTPALYNVPLLTEHGFCYNTPVQHQNLEESLIEAWSEVAVETFAQIPHLTSEGETAQAPVVSCVQYLCIPAQTISILQNDVVGKGSDPPTGSPALTHTRRRSVTLLAAGSGTTIYQKSTTRSLLLAVYY